MRDLTRTLNYPDKENYPQENACMLKLKLSRKKTTLSVTKKKYNALKLLVEIQLTNWMNRLLLALGKMTEKKEKPLGPFLCLWLLIRQNPRW